MNAVESIAKTPVATFVTAAYFVTQRGKLWVSWCFTMRITAAHLGALVPRGIEGVEKFLDLPHKDYPNRKIISDMGGEASVRKYAFTPDQLADMIDTQPNGIDGPMLTNGHANIFYVIGVDKIMFGVEIRWRSHRSGWRVRAWDPMSSSEWSAGGRVFRKTRLRRRVSRL